MSSTSDLLTAPFDDGATRLPADGGVIVLNARPGLPFAPDVTVCEQGFRPTHDALAAEGRRVSPKLPQDVGTCEASAVLLSRSRAKNRADFARAWSMTAPGGVVVVAGAKTEGVESLQKELRGLIELGGARPGGHGRAIWAARTERSPDVFSAWIEAAAPAPRAELADGRRFVTCAGIFSWDAPDPASTLLKEALPELHGAVADLGAGWGFLTDAALRFPKVKRIDAIEAEHDALECARANVTDSRASFVWADAGDAKLAEREYDFVVTNPPFHDGGKVSVAVGERLLRAAARLLKPNGTVLAVANRTLPYERSLSECFAKSEVLLATSAYKVLRADRPVPASRRTTRGGRAGRRS